MFYFSGEWGKSRAGEGEEGHGHATGGIINKFTCILRLFYFRYIMYVFTCTSEEEIAAGILASSSSAVSHIGHDHKDKGGGHIRSGKVD